MMSTKCYVCWLWLLSAVPFGLATWVVPIEVLITGGIVLDNAHRLSPIATAWTHRGFREVMLQRPWHTIALPLGLLILAIGVGLITSLGWTSFIGAPGALFRVTDWRNPYPVVMWIYWIWNGYHFGMQNFGVVSLLRARRNQWQRTCDMSWTVGLTVAAIFISPSAVSFNHWIMELGLCARVSRHGVLLMVLMLGFGALALLWMTASPDGRMTTRITPITLVLLIASVGLSFWHFLQDRWMWQFSNRQVRATIGKELFA